MVLTAGLKVNVIILAWRSWGEPIRRSHRGFLLRLGPPSEVGLDCSIHNYTGQFRSSLVAKDMWGSQYGSTIRKLGCWLLKLLRMIFSSGLNVQRGRKHTGVQIHSHITVMLQVDKICWICSFLFFPVVRQRHAANVSIPLHLNQISFQCTNMEHILTYDSFNYLNLTYFNMKPPCALA